MFYVWEFSNCGKCYCWSKERTNLKFGYSLCSSLTISQSLKRCPLMARARLVLTPRFPVLGACLHNYGPRTARNRALNFPFASYLRNGLGL